MKTLIFFFLFANIVFSSEIFDEIGRYRTKIPDIQEIPVNKSNEQIYFNFLSYQINIQTFISKPATIIIEQDTVLLLKQSINFKIWGEYFDKVVSFDFDNNGLKDICIISVPVGCSGDAANIIQANAILFFKNKPPKIYTFSSFFVIENLFGDYNNDNIFDWVCIKQIRKTGKIFYVANVFSIINGKITNLSKEMKTFPMCFLQKNGFMHIEKVSPFLRNDLIFDNPNIFLIK